MGTKGFAFGILIGGAMGCLIVTIYYGILSRNPKKVKKLYIEAYDERNKLVLYAAAVANFSLALCGSWHFNAAETWHLYLRHHCRWTALVAEQTDGGDGIRRW